MRRLEGKVAIITGAGLGIGRAAALLFAHEGARVVVAEVNEEAGREAAEAVREAGGEALFVATDVTQPESVAATVARAKERYGRLDILYNNAGGSTLRDGPTVEAPEEVFWHSLRLDVYGTWLCCKHAIPEIAAAGGGVIVNTSSMVALIGRKNAHSYTAAKGAVTALTRALAVEYAPAGIRVNAVAPGVTRSERVIDRIASGRIAPYIADRHHFGYPEPEDVARAALFLASREAAHVTGHVLPVDGGLTMS